VGAYCRYPAPKRRRAGQSRQQSGPPREAPHEGSLHQITERDLREWGRLDQLSRPGASVVTRPEPANVSPSREHYRYAFGDDDVPDDPCMV